MSENQKDSEDPDSILARDLENFRLSHPEIETIELLTVRGTRLRFPEANQAAPSIVSVQPVHRLYCQPYTSPSDLIQLVQQRSLVVEDPDHAAEWINKVGYYRLKGYGLQFRLHDVSGNLTESYQPGTRFEALIDLYEFDRHLRLLVLDAVERIEVAFRCRFNDTLASRHGSHWFMDPARFSDKRDEKTGELIFNHEDFLMKTSEEARRNKEIVDLNDLLIKHPDVALGPMGFPSDWRIRLERLRSS